MAAKRTPGSKAATKKMISHKPKLGGSNPPGFEFNPKRAAGKKASRAVAKSAPPNIQKKPRKKAS